MRSWKVEISVVVFIWGKKCFKAYTGIHRDNDYIASKIRMCHAQNGRKYF